MSINIGPAPTDELRPRITVIGVGGAGGNAIANMIEANIEGVDFIVANTDAQALGHAASDARIQLGPDITGGLGAGARPEVGKAAAEETVSDIEDALEGVNMCFIAAGMGGGTGTGAAPVIAEAARSKGVLTVGVVTKPFLFEGTRRMRAAEAGIEELQKHVDTLIVIPNQNLFLIAKAETTFKEAFQLADEVLQQGVRSITDLMVMPGLINLDFADVKSVMEEMGKAMMGTGDGEGENRAVEAAEKAIANPLLDGVSMQGAKAVIISILGGDDMKLLEVDEAANLIRDLVDEDANIILGSAYNPELEGKIRVSVVATGIEADVNARDASSDAHSLRLSASQAPKRPVLELPTDDELDEDGPDSGEGSASAFGNLSSMDGADGADDSGDFSDDDSDDDGIVDPLAGLRSDTDENEDGETSEFTADIHAEADKDQGGSSLQEDEAGFDGADNKADQAEAPQFAAPTGSDDATGEDQSDAQVLNLADEAGGGNDDAGDKSADDDDVARAQDELLLDADRLADEDKPVQRNEESSAESSAKPSDPPPAPGRRRGLVSGAEGGGNGNQSGNGGGAAGGSTLFERMANLSRGSTSDASGDADEEDEEDEGSSLSIPRFLGRQNNQ